MAKKIKTKSIDHPLEGVFEIEENTTIVEYEEKLPSTIIKHENYDKKDTEIEQQFQEIYDLSLDMYESQMQDIEDIEGKYRARNNEIAVQTLNTALNAAKEKAALKSHKDKLENPFNDENGNKRIINNNLVVDRNDLLKMMSGEK